MATTAESGLFKLPAELRNRIYELAIVEPDPIKVPIASALVEPGLLHVNRQLHADATPIYYGQNTFDTHEPSRQGHYSPHGLDDAGQWLQRLPDWKLRALARVSFCSNGTWSLYIDEGPDSRALQLLKRIDEMLAKFGRSLVGRSAILVPALVDFKMWTTRYITAEEFSERLQRRGGSGRRYDE